jgi:hypothetical protein
MKNQYIPEMIIKLKEDRMHLILLWEKAHNQYYDDIGTSREFIWEIEKAVIELSEEIQRLTAPEEKRKLTPEDWGFYSTPVKEGPAQ